MKKRIAICESGDIFGNILDAKEKDNCNSDLKDFDCTLLDKGRESKELITLIEGNTIPDTRIIELDEGLEYEVIEDAEYGNGDTLITGNNLNIMHFNGNSAESLIEDEEVFTPFKIIK